jgi:hypothetical protein
MSDVILSAYHGGLGDNLQFSTLPEEFFKQQGRETYIWSRSTFRNPEIYDLVWGHNPYIKGIKDGEWSAGDTPEIGHRNITGDCISNWEALHGLNPVNKYPKIYYQPKKIDEFSDVMIVDLSAISLAYDRNKILELYNSVKTQYNKSFFGIEFKRKINHQGSHTVYDPKVDAIIEIENLLTYVDIIYSSYGIISLHSGQNHLASAIKANYNSNLEIFALMDSESYDHQYNKGIFIFDNVNYLRY